MQSLITLSLVLNILVLVPVCWGLVTNANWVAPVYGAPSQARAILLAVYIAIAIVSALLLGLGDPKLVLALLLVQVLYKLITPLTVGTFANPVVVSNLLIALVHLVTLTVIWRTLA